MGRKRKPGKREPNGKLSRVPADVAARRKDGLDREEQDTIAVAIEARQRVFGLPPAISRDQMAGSAVGRYCLQCVITRTQYDAAMLYLADCEAYSHAIGTPGIPRAVDHDRAVLAAKQPPLPGAVARQPGDFDHRHLRTPVRIGAPVGASGR